MEGTGDDPTASPAASPATTPTEPPTSNANRFGALYAAGWVMMFLWLIAF